MDSDIVKRIFADYENTRTRKKAERNARVEKVYAQFPRLAQIKREINLAGAKNMAMILKNPQKGDEYNRQLKIKIDTLTEESNEIIRENGISPDFDKVEYVCPKCMDTGYIEHQKCSCFSKKLIEGAYSKSNMGQLLNYQTFENFHLDCYSDKVYYEKTTQTIREYMKGVLEGCIKFCDDFGTKNDDHRSLLFFGTSGLGKTFLSSCIAKRLIEKGYDVMYVTASQLFNAYDDVKFGKGDVRAKREMVEKFKNCDLLIIDDLGTEAATRFTESYIFELVNERIIAGKKMIISTNYSIKNMTQLYTARFTSRIYEFFRGIHFVGDDIRVKSVM